MLFIGLSAINSLTLNPSQKSYEEGAIVIEVSQGKKPKLRAVKNLSAIT